VLAPAVWRLGRWFCRAGATYLKLQRGPKECLQATAYVDAAELTLTREGTDQPPVWQVAAELLVVVQQGDYVEQSNQFNGPVIAGTIGKSNVRTLTQSSANMYRSIADEVDLALLAQELAAIRAKAASQATKADHFADLSSVASAEQAAKSNDRRGALDHLKNAGTWFWDVANKVGIGVAIGMAKDAIG